MASSPPPPSRTGSYASQASSLTAVTTVSQAESEAQLRAKLVGFYRMYDPHKLEDPTEVNDLVRWARRYGQDALFHLLFRKYGVDIDNVDTSEDAWEQVKSDLVRFYRKHDKTKDARAIDEIYRWTRAHGLGALNERLLAKYGVPLSSVRDAQQGGWKNRWRHVIVHQNKENLVDQLLAFFAVHDPERPRDDAEALATWAASHGGVDALNATLRDKYDGKDLSHVRMAAGATPDERKYNLRQRLTSFFKAHDPDNFPSPEALHALAEWGATNYDALNQHLLVRYGYDLDTAEVRPEVVRQRLYAFFSKHDPTNKKKRGKNTLEDLVQLAMDKGLEALKVRLLKDYGRTLAEDDEEEYAESPAGVPPGTPGQVRPEPQQEKGKKGGLRRSLSRAIRRSFKLDGGE